MTNREWLSTLSDEEFSAWCTRGLTFIQAKIENDELKITNILPVYYPTMQDVLGSFVGDRTERILKWLKCEKKSHKVSIKEEK